MTMKVTGSTMDFDAIARFVSRRRPSEFAIGRLQHVNLILTRCDSFEVALFKTTGVQRSEKKGNHHNPTRNGLLL